MEAEAWAFARDLMIFVYNHYNKKYWVRHLNGCKPFQEEMGRTVVSFHVVFSKFLDELSNVICPEICKNEKAFYEFAETLVASYWKGYIFLELITICSCISYVAVCKSGRPRIMNFGCELIVKCFQRLQWDFYAEGGWLNFSIYCMLYARVLQELQAKNHH
ncbi:hypothetical protein AVEN_88716-1 [Araneus ventricosus]|uniref:Uncharacterized protein n=1 Tax=Araneus ventricosus TaxID=182803 RepID=A0A4Y2V6B1_ARAVE|nr:hypothetical protein AVEN_122209-1 [Araneus ventricosus]GBO16154.1 hypothetical protein AVEN_55553-1 [Araneus ventricosus]GBO20105.1 hypothetical protein AVEN_34846-1 [Araneus ventricosus]GBO20108.1 hypothetical protein AVEN_88716-1 [Araneus ventricosus]